MNKNGDRESKGDGNSDQPRQQPDRHQGCTKEFREYHQRHRRSRTQVQRIGKLRRPRKELLQRRPALIDDQEPSKDNPHEQQGFRREPFKLIEIPQFHNLKLRLNLIFYLVFYYFATDTKTSRHNVKNLKK